MEKGIVLSDHRENLLSLLGGKEGEIEEWAEAAAPYSKLLACLDLKGPFYVYRRRQAEDDFALVVLVHKARESQYDALAAALREGVELPWPVACHAFAGEQFHGQRGRAWRALQGNIHLTLYRKLDLDCAQNQVALTILPTIAAMDSLTFLGRGHWGQGIKWINDITVGDSKIGGVLTSTQIRGNRVESLLSGVGLNVGAKPDISPDRLALKADCLGAFLPQVSYADVFWRFLRDYSHRLGQLLACGPGGFMEEYRRYSILIGREVCVWEEAGRDGLSPGEGQPRFCGVVTAIADDLALIVGGQRVTDGRLSLARPCELFDWPCRWR